MLYFDDAKKIDAQLAKKCRNCSYRERGCLSEYFSRARAPNGEKAKIVIIINKDTGNVIGWGGLFEFWNDCNDCPEIMVYVRLRARRQGYGSQIVKTLTSKLTSNKKENIRVYRPEWDKLNIFYGKKLGNLNLNVA